MTEKLTPVEERFANEVALGKSQAAAYRIANPRSTKWKDGSVYVKASLMMGKDNRRTLLHVRLRGGLAVSSRGDVSIVTDLRGVVSFD